MTKQLFKLTTKDLMSYFKSPQFEEFMKSLAVLENEHQVEEPFFRDNIDDLLEWQQQLPGGVINIKRDFIKVYAKSNKIEKGEYKNKAFFNQSQQRTKTLNEFFRLLDAAVASKKVLPFEAFAQHLGMTRDELADLLERVNWSDYQPVVEEEEEEEEEFKFPIHIEKDFFKYYHHVDRPTQLDIQDRTTQGISSDHHEKMSAFFTWLDMTKLEDDIQFEEIIRQTDLHPQELIRYLDRINWQ
jgi:hypothetical protein